MQRKLIDDLKTAIQKDEFCDYLIGSRQYKYVAQYADIPTDVDYVLTAIKYYYEEGHREVYPLLKENILKLSKDQDLYWFAVYYLDAYLNLSEVIRGDQDEESFVDITLRNIAKRKSELFDNKQWIGANMENGLWGGFIHMVGLIAKAHPRLKLDAAKLL